MNNQQLLKPHIRLTEKALQEIFHMARGIEAQTDDEGVFHPSKDFLGEFTCAYLLRAKQTHALTIWQEVISYCIGDSSIPFHELPYSEQKFLGTTERMATALRRRKRFLQYCLEGDNLRKLIKHVQKGTPREKSGIPEF